MINRIAAATRRCLPPLPGCAAKERTRPEPGEQIVDFGGAGASRCGARSGDWQGWGYQHRALFFDTKALP